MVTVRVVTFHCQDNFERCVEHEPNSLHSILWVLFPCFLHCFDEVYNISLGDKLAQCRSAHLQRTQGHYSLGQETEEAVLRPYCRNLSSHRAEPNGVHLFWQYEDEHRRADRTTVCQLQRCLNPFRTTTSPHASCQKLGPSAA